MSGTGLTQIILMHQDVEVARTLEGNISGEWDIKNPHLLPTGFVLWSSKNNPQKAYAELYGRNGGNIGRALGGEYGKQVEIMADMLTGPLDIAWRQLNSDNVQTWLAYRVLPLSRENAKKLYQMMALSQSQTTVEKAKIAMSIHGLSITDSYWITTSTLQKTWVDVDIRRNKLSQGLAVLALTGSSFTLQTDPLRSRLEAAAELTTNGAYPKGIFRENDSLYMYKSGSMHTVAAEYAVAKILASSNVFSYVDYVYDDKKYGIPCAKCKLLTNSRRDLVPALMVPENAVGFALNNFRQQLAQMCVVDYITANPDRHMQNWGFFREAPTWQITGLHSLFDHNNAFDIEELKGIRGALSVLDYDTRSTQPQGLLVAAQRMLKSSDFRFVKPVSRAAFKYFGENRDTMLNAFVERCNILGIPVQIGR